MKEKDKIMKEENLTQRVIDPSTGRDITGEYIKERLKELEILAEDIIQSALQEYKKDKSKNKDIYEKAYWKIHNELGMGSIGPATAAAGPLMEKKKQKLAELMEINSKDFY